jgi:streptomycin 6-kinase
VAHDVERRALLLERCEPGTPLSAEHPGFALDILIGHLPRLWIPAPPTIPSLAGEVERLIHSLTWAREKADGRVDRRMIDAAVEAMTRLVATQGEQVLVHQDLHAGNVLRAEREPWLAIDPKPLSGEREFAVAPVVRSSELGHSRLAVLERLDRLCGALGLDRDRARGWTIAQTVAWMPPITDESSDDIARLSAGYWKAEGRISTGLA